MHALVHRCINQHTTFEAPIASSNLKISLGPKFNKLDSVGLMQLTLVSISKSRDTKTRPNIKNPARSNFDIVP